MQLSGRTLVQCVPGFGPQHCKEKKKKKKDFTGGKENEVYEDGNQYLSVALLQSISCTVQFQCQLLYGLMLIFVLSLIRYAKLIDILFIQNII